MIRLLFTWVALMELYYFVKHSNLQYYVIRYSTFLKENLENIDTQVFQTVILGTN